MGRAFHTNITYLVSVQCAQGHGLQLTHVGRHTNNEEAYVGCIAAFVKKLGLKKPIICGASMAGQISLACAIHADTVGCAGTIPLQGSDYLNMERAWGDQSPFVNQALWNPEWIYGECTRRWLLRRVVLTASRQA